MIYELAIREFEKLLTEIEAARDQSEYPEDSLTSSLFRNTKTLIGTYSAELKEDFQKDLNEAKDTTGNNYWKLNHLYPLVQDIIAHLRRNQNLEEGTSNQTRNGKTLQAPVNYKVASDAIRKLYVEMVEVLSTDENLEKKHSYVDSAYERTANLIANIYRLDSDFNRISKQLTDLNERFGDAGNYKRLERLKLFLDSIWEDIEQKEKLNSGSLVVSPGRYSELVAAFDLKDKQLNALTKKLEDKEKHIVKITDDFEKHIKSVSAGQNKSPEFKILFYSLLASSLTYLNFTVPFLLGRVNWIEVLWIQVAILITILVFYFRSVPGWVQFLVGTIIAILAIITDL